MTWEIDVILLGSRGVISSVRGCIAGPNLRVITRKICTPLGNLLILEIQKVRRGDRIRRRRRRGRHLSKASLFSPQKLFYLVRNLRSIGKRSNFAKDKEEAVFSFPDAR